MSTEQFYCKWKVLLVQEHPWRGLLAILVILGFGIASYFLTQDMILCLFSLLVLLLTTSSFFFPIQYCFDGKELTIAHINKIRKINLEELDSYCAQFPNLKFYRKNGTLHTSLRFSAIDSEKYQKVLNYLTQNNILPLDK